MLNAFWSRHLCSFIVILWLIQVTKNRLCLVEPFGQLLFAIFTVLTLDLSRITTKHVTSMMSLFHYLAKHVLQFLWSQRIWFPNNLFWQPLCDLMSLSNSMLTSSGNNTFSTFSISFCNSELRSAPNAFAASFVFGLHGQMLDLGFDSECTIELSNSRHVRDAPKQVRNDPTTIRKC